MTPAEREELLSLWASPSSNSEKEQQDRAERMVRNAVESWPVFNTVKYRIYTKGSYPNNTNVRADSDVDVVVECHEVLYYDYADGVTGDPSPPYPYQGPWTPPRWRSEVDEAMVHTFGCDAVDTSGKIGSSHLVGFCSQVITEGGCLVDTGSDCFRRPVRVAA